MSIPTYSVLVTFNLTDEQIDTNYVCIENVSKIHTYKIYYLHDLKYCQNSSHLYVC